MHTFTPWTALAGGLLIGLAASVLLWLNGRIAGISGILGRLLLLPRGDVLWRLLFLAGLVAGAALCYLLGAEPPRARPGFPAWLLVAAGFLVGFGTSLSNGCTSGHGVCGLARLSVRSLAAVAVFMVAAFITTWVIRHVFGVL